MADGRDPHGLAPGGCGPHGRKLDGWLVIDKPSGMTSNRVVERVRRATGVKAGHAGTLDPLATGVLPVALGEATKTVAYAMGGQKRYRFTIRWGVARDTDDSEGEILAESAGAAGTGRDRGDAAGALPGRSCRRPPAYSAIKLAGRRAYALARAGQSPALAPRPVEIASLRLASVPDRDHAEFEAMVGKGTYIRALARDLARRSELSAMSRHCAGWRSGASPKRRRFRWNRWGPWRIVAAACGHLLPIETALDDIPALALTAERGGPPALRPTGDAGAVAGARRTPSSSATGAVVGVWHDHALIALARVEDGCLRPVRVINC